MNFPNKHNKVWLFFFFFLKKEQVEEKMGCVHSPFCLSWSMCFCTIGTLDESKQILSVGCSSRYFPWMKNNEIHFISEFLSLCCVLVRICRRSLSKELHSLLSSKCPFDVELCCQDAPAVPVTSFHSKSTKCKDQSVSNLNKWLVCFPHLFVHVKGSIYIPHW